MEVPHLLLLVSKSSIGNREQLANQDLATTMLAGLTPLEILDGADPANRERRNQLFGISGLRAKYPQLFVVKSKDESEAPTFVGDFETIQELNECKLLTKADLLGVEESDAESRNISSSSSISGSSGSSTEKKKKKEESGDHTAMESTSRGMPMTGEENATTTTTTNTNIVSAQLLLLISNLSGNRQQDSNQTRLLQLLQSKRLFSSSTNNTNTNTNTNTTTNTTTNTNTIIETLDGSDPRVKERRNALFAISGLHAKYPQLFIVVETPKVSFLSFLATKTKTIFLGDYDTIQAMEKNGLLTEAGIVAELTRQERENGGNKWLVVGAHVAVVAAVVVGIAKLHKKY